MRVIAFEADFTAACFTLVTGLVQAKNADDLAVLAPAHLYKYV